MLFRLRVLRARLQQRLLAAAKQAELRQRRAAGRRISLIIYLADDDRVDHLLKLHLRHDKARGVAQAGVSLALRRPQQDDDSVDISGGKRTPDLIVQYQLMGT